MDNILLQNYSYLCKQSSENLQLQDALPEQENNYQFVGSFFGNTGIISVTNKIR